MKQVNLPMKLFALAAAGLVAFGGWSYFYGGREGAYAPPLTSSDPTVPFPFPEVEESFSQAYGENEDVVGWLYVPGTEINEAVVQGKDNDFYLRRNAKKNYSYAGSLFLDYRGDFSAPKQNNVIYGHNLGSPMGRKDNPNGEKFAQLLKLEDEAFARQTPYLYLKTQEESQIYQIFSVFYSEAYTSPVEYHHDSYPDGEFTQLIADLRERSLFDYPVEVGPDDRLLTLSTCSYKYGTYGQNPNQRFVVVGRLVSAEESYSQTVQLSPNPDAKPPAFLQ